MYCLLRKAQNRIRIRFSPVCFPVSIKVQSHSTLFVPCELWGIFLHTDKTIQMLQVYKEETYRTENNASQLYMHQ